MGIGYRVFIVSGDEIVAPLSQTAFRQFWHEGKPVLRRYAKQTVDLAMAIYETANRKPAYMVQVDGLRCRVLASGKMDQKFFHETLRLAVNRLEPIGESAPARVIAGTVIDARHDFYKRQYEAKGRRISLKLKMRIQKALGL